MMSSGTYSLSTLLVLTVLFYVIQASSFEDTRCKCVCDSRWDDAGDRVKAVYTDTIRSEDCNCENVVMPQSPELQCSKCVCRTETRNTTTIKVVVIFIICVVSLLFVYMLFLICLDPIIQRRPAHYQQHTNEEVNLEDMSGGRTEGAVTPTMGATADMTARQRSLLNMVQKEQKKWKGTVQEQRKNIYDRHAMLN